MQNEWVALAVIGQPHGVSGRVKVKSFTDPADDFAANPALTYADGTALKLKITGHTQGMAIVSIDGVTDRNQAELLRGKKLGIPASALPRLTNPDEYYIDDLIGMQVIEDGDRPFGQVSNVMNYGAGDIIEIRHTDQSQGLYAFNEKTFPRIDTQARRLTINPPIVIGLDARDDEESA